MAHTPGPWEDVPTMEHSSTAHRVITGGPRGLPHVAYIPKNGYAAIEAEALDNARLIAAAPDLLAVSQAIRDLFARPLPSVGDLLALEPLARAAIAKATGEQP